MVIAFTVTRLCGAASLHIATGSQMRMVIDCYQGTIFNWCDAVLANLKGPLTREKNEKLNTFGYGPLVVSFVLERVPMLIPQQLTVKAGLPREPKLMRWVAVMAHHLTRARRLSDLDRSIFTGWRTRSSRYRIFHMPELIFVEIRT